MSTSDQILSILNILSSSFPNRSLEQRTVQLYVEHLADIPIYLLELAAQQHIAESNWFPKIAELRLIAARIAGTHDFKALGPIPNDILAAEAKALEDAFYHDGTLDHESWSSLADRFEHADRPHRAAHTRHKFQRLLAIQAERESQDVIDFSETLPEIVLPQKAISNSKLTIPNP